LDCIHVYLVDDHPLVREWLGDLLRLEPDIVVDGASGEPAAALAAMVARAPDVAIVDLSLGSGSGLELIQEMQSQLPRTRVLVLSMHEGIGEVERALRAGARGYVMKSESTVQVVAAIRQVHAGRLYADAGVLTQLTERRLGRSPNGMQRPAETLSARELDVFCRLGDGHSTRRISKDLGIGQNTVQTYCARIKEKLGFADGSELVLAAVRWREGGHSG
jgi:DNA-binding NarL/FixJ family response regulator